MESFRPDPIYEFPPFFTRQPNEDTWKAQLKQWHRVIIEYCKSRSKWQVAYSSDVFSNPRIQRQLDAETVKAILDDMCKTGSAERLGPSEVYVYAHKPSELAYALKHWSEATGHGGSVLTFYELQEGDLPGLDAFKGIDTYLLKKVTEFMIKQGDGAGLKEDNEMVGLKLAAA